MAFPTLAELDAIVLPAMATSAELLATHRTRDGVSTLCTAWLDHIPVQAYSDSGVVITSPAWEVVIQRADVLRPVEGDTVTIGAETWRLTNRIASDSGQTRWSVAPVRADGS